MPCVVCSTKSEVDSTSLPVVTCRRCATTMAEIVARDAAGKTPKVLEALQYDADTQTFLDVAAAYEEMNLHADAAVSAARGLLKCDGVTYDKLGSRCLAIIVRSHERAGTASALVRRCRWAQRAS